MTTTEPNKVRETQIENQIYGYRKSKSIDLGGLAYGPSNSSINLRNNTPVELVFGLLFSGSVVGAIEGFNYSEQYPYIGAIGGYFIGGLFGAISITLGNSILKDVKSMVLNYRIDKSL